MRRRPSKYQVCQHEKRSQIEIALVQKVPARVIARRFGIHSDAVYRRKHLSPKVAAAILSAQKPSAVDLEQLQASESEGLVAQLITQRARLQTSASSKPAQK